MFARVPKSSVPYLMLWIEVHMLDVYFEALWHIPINANRQANRDIFAVAKS